ncbi:hypothetical protein D5086_030008 [Populus alba]|uniref:Uncharacterized protein n=1 Tax=Populus alba TaxID=43335 RepID=A0ACC4AMB4_POPAL
MLISMEICAKDLELLLETGLEFQIPDITIRARKHLTHAVVSFRHRPYLEFNPEHRTTKKSNLLFSFLFYSDSHGGMFKNKRECRKSDIKHSCHQSVAYTESTLPLAGVT